MKTLAALLVLSYSQRGYFETRISLFPQTAPGDSGRAIAESLLRYEPSLRLTNDLRLAAAFDTRTDTHRQVERSPRFDWQDRSLARPAVSLRRFSLQYSRGPLTAEFGKQFIRWGKADILNPTDRFAPRDFLAVTDTEFLGVTAARITVEARGNTLDLVYQPRFTPSRTPLLNQRWTVLPEGASVVDYGAAYPGRGAFGARWNHLGRGYEMSLSFYDGFNHLPLFNIYPLDERTAGIERFYPRLRTYGADAAVPLPWFTVKGEAAWFSSSTPQADEYVIYVVQLERQIGELSLTGGYAGEAVTTRRSPFDFMPDRGIARSLLGSARYTLDANRSLALETAVRQNGRGSYTKAEYSQAFGQHWRLSAGFVWIRGEAGDFLGQYRRNSHALLTLRYSF